MKVTRTYLDGCRFCRASGYVYPMIPSGTSFSSLCPVCNGGKTILVTEEYELPDNTYLITDNPFNNGANEG